MLKQYYFDGINYSGFDIDKEVEDKISFVISKLFAFEPIVFVSLFISCIKKSSFLPTAIFSFVRFKN